MGIFRVVGGEPVQWRRRGSSARLEAADGSSSAPKVCKAGRDGDEGFAPDDVAAGIFITASHFLRFIRLLVGDSSH